MRPAKILLLMYKMERAGAEAVVYAIARELDRERFLPVLCSLKGGAMVEEFRGLGVPVHILGKKHRGDWGPLFALVRLLRRERIALVHSHTYSPGLWGRLAGTLAGRVALVHTEHTLSERKSAFQRWTDRRLAERTCCIVAVSEAVRRSLIVCSRVPAERVRVIYNGIEPPAAGAGDLSAHEGELRRELGLPPGCRVVATVGRLEPPKGHRHLLEAAARLLHEHPAALFLLVGEGSLRRELEELSAGLAIAERVRFAGFRADVAQILGIADVCVVPSTREGFSVTVLEAMAAGRPIIATDVGGNAEALEHGVSGLIVPPASPEALAVAISRVLSRDAEARALGAQARQRFESKFTVERMVEETEALYARCLAAAHQTPRR